VKIEKIKWPNESPCAVMLTFNLDAEVFWMGLGDCSRRPKTLSMGEYGMKRGLDRVVDLLDARDLPATFFIPGLVAERYPEKIQMLAERGYEIGLHGYAHENFGHLAGDEIERVLEKGASAIEKITGKSPRGFRAPEGELTAEIYPKLAKLGFLYSSSMFGDDRPYTVSAEGENKEILEIPAPWEISDFPYFGFNYTPAFPAGQGRIANYSHVQSMFIEEYKAYYYYGLCYVPQFDPQTIATPGRIDILRNVLDYIQAQGKAWFCTGQEMTDYWANQYGQEKPLS
jgi:peptidoglycan/xylan/chitin deacetylase (PgdA/CDA1 family)